MRVEILRPTGGELAKFEADVQLSETGGANIQINIAGLNLPDYGLYQISVMVGDQLPKSIGLTVAKSGSAKG